MNYDELKKIVNTNSDISKKIYMCNFLTCKTEKMKNTKISLVKNLLGSMLLLFGWIMNMVDFQNKKYSAIKIQLPIMLANY